MTLLHSASLRPLARLAPLALAAFLVACAQMPGAGSAPARSTIASPVRP